jgi:hypothetical protein
MSKARFPIVSVVLYVLAALMAFYTAWAARNSIQIVSDAVAQNQLVVSGSEFEVASFFMSNFAQYGLYAVILFSLGWIVQNQASYLFGDRVVTSEEMLDDDDYEDDEEELEEAVLIEDEQSDLKQGGGEV